MDSLVNKMLSYRNTLLDNEVALRILALEIKKVCEGDTQLGAYLLNFIYDENNKAYHSQVDTWQRAFGYNDMYDDVFRIGSFMHQEKFEFTNGSKDYILWTWKGDYWNLQSGAEIGLYVYNRTSHGTQQYDSVNFELPMTLNLYNYYGKDNRNNFV